jgi:hypothetical protein
VIVRVRFDYVFHGTDVRVEVSALANNKPVAYGASDSVPEAIALCVADAIRRGATDALEQLTAMQETASLDRRTVPRAAS